MKVVGHVPGKELLKSFKRVEEVLSLGIGVEIQLASEILDRFTLKDFGALRKLIGNRTVTVHAPFLDLNPGATDSLVLKATRKRFKETLVAAKILEAETIVFHTGYHPAKVDPIYEEWFERAVETFEEVAERTPCPVALENVFDRSPVHLERLLESLPPKVGVCIDVGHLNLFSEVPLSDWIERFKGRIFEFHVHDNGGEKDEHAPIGSGKLDLDVFFSLLEKIPDNYIFNLENKSVDDIKSSLEVLRRKTEWHYR
ncbi:sugar phosphate isomerase/epimerase family protein [Phorcysia thermohydrogeniphila]|uniref:Sugar phosphate isomerase/epimerase n=1 Tax=Phorcysia thermohydrogeniphila TaxID=936138 RepID=A0A4R1GQ22_9BACT|nr:sugar phosphate isomerase/epimerase family protein [Phorcysia thermohydrogeniphila]TCK06612.1 sugar phosphate isomerase/epimerase [Phorcysia thermohydrogeniphila]